ncbi:MAG: hypothetical protein RIS35_2480 [Pseudomonadota bacterium]|jgi:hypothetical protein
MIGAANLTPDDPRAGIFAALLRDARFRIYKGDEEYLCEALKAASERLLGIRRGDAVNALLDWIKVSIMRDAPYCRTVRGWLITIGVPQDDVSDERLREYRLRWCDSLIRHFEGAEA